MSAPALAIEGLTRILVNVPLGAPGARVAEAAATLARHHGAQLALVHGLSPLDGPLPAGTQAMAQREECRTAERELRSLAMSIASETLSVTAEVRNEAPVDALSSEAQEHGGELAVVRAHQRAACISRFSNRSLRRAVDELPIALLALHGSDAEDFHRPRRPLLLARNRREANAAARTLVAFAGPWRSECRVLLLGWADERNERDPSERSQLEDAARGLQTQGFSARVAFTNEMAPDRVEQERRNFSGDLVVASDTWCAGDRAIGGTLSHIAGPLGCPLLVAPLDKDR